GWGLGNRDREQSLLRRVSFGAERKSGRGAGGHAPQPRTSNPMFRPARMLARRDLILARYYGGKTPVPPALEDSIPEIPAIEPPVLPPILDTVVVDTLVVPDTTKDHPDSGGPVDSVRLVFAGPRLVYKPERHHE